MQENVDRLTKWAERLRKELPKFQYTQRPGEIQVDNVAAYGDWDITFADLQKMSEICDGTKNINFHYWYEPGYSEYTPSGTSASLVIKAPQ